MSILFDILYLLAGIWYVPLYLCKRKFHKGFLCRLGVLPKGIVFRDPVWIHAVSVGEAVSIRGLVQQLREAFPKRQFLFTTVTATGNEIVKQMAGPQDAVMYLPLDFSLIVRSVVSRVNPAAFIVAETEIWPNLITELSRRRVPIIGVNARVSDRSYPRYLAVKRILAPLLARYDFFCAQTKTDATRFEGLGVSPQKVRVTGNMKFDLKKPEQGMGNVRQELGLAADDKVLVAGSTHPGEEEQVLEAYAALRGEFPSLRLVLVPRHPERSQDVVRLAASKGFIGVRVSQHGEGAPASAGIKVFIVDSVGQLMRYYAQADAVFVGGSLVPVGGHNILEPAIFAKPVFFGTHMFNFRDISELFLREKAGVEVDSATGLSQAVAEVLRDPLRGMDLGQRGKNLVMQNQGATFFTAKAIREALGKKV